MPIKLNAIGESIGPLTRHYNWKDIILYALGVGAGFSELEYCYERDLKIIPTFLMAMVFDFFFAAGKAARLNPFGILHGEQDLIFHHPIPKQGTLITEGSITHIYDKGKKKGALVIAESETVHSEALHLMTGITTIFSRLDGGFRGEDAPDSRFAFPDRDPDFRETTSLSPDQPLLYRLSGDFFELHVDPEFARNSGFEGPIMHGLCTQGFACRALIHHLVPKEPERVKRIFCRFSKFLYPGSRISTQIWKTDPGKALWRTMNADTGEVVIDRGIFEYSLK